MTLLFMDGFQDALLLPKPEWGTVAGSATTGRDGSTNGAARFTTSSSMTLTPSSTAATAIAGTAWKNGTMTTAAIPLLFKDTAGTSQIFIMNTAGGMIEVRKQFSNGTIIGTSSGHTPMASGEWHYIEAKVILHTSSGTVIVRLDGVTVLTITGVATSTLTSNVGSIAKTGAGSITTDWDDFYLCDAVDASASQGRANNDFLGDIRIQSLYPTSAGDSTGWTPSTGSNFAAVDETPPNTSDYVSNVATGAGTRDLYNLTDLTGTIVSIFAVRETIYAQKTDSGSALIKPVIKENSVVTSDASQALGVGQFAVIAGGLKAVKPSGSNSVWTTSDVNALQAGVEVG